MTSTFHSKTRTSVQWVPKLREAPAVADDQPQPAVADEPGEPRPSDAELATPLGRSSEPEGRHAADGEGSDCHSIAGDTAASEAEDETWNSHLAKHQQKVAPQIWLHGEPDRSRGESSKWNAEPEVGNIGVYFGNWGQLATNALTKDRDKQARVDTYTRQIQKNPAHILILCETNATVEALLKQPPYQGDPGAQGLEGRDGHEHYVVRGSEREQAVLIAARMDNTTFLHCLEYEAYPDHPYKLKGRQKEATSRMLTCKVGFKQNVGHIGKELVVTGVHGHCRTMKIEWPLAWQAFWDRLASKIKKYGTQILAGDFNMSVTQVVTQLRSRGITCDCIAWYPWRSTTSVHGQTLGIESCGIFYIGGVVGVTMNWMLTDINILTAVADDMDRLCSEKRRDLLDRYDGFSGPPPGQHWACYRSQKHVECYAEKSLTQRLVELLTPSTTQEELDMLPRGKNKYCPHLRFKQKKMDLAEWLVDGRLHNGAHFPLCVFTHNASARSKERAMERASKKTEKYGKGGQPTLLTLALCRYRTTNPVS